MVYVSDILIDVRLIWILFNQIKNIFVLKFNLNTRVKLLKYHKNT